MTARLEVDGLTVRRGGRAIVSEVSLSLRATEVVAILGPNGAGKSTLVRAMMGLVSSEGRVTLDGEPLGSFSARDRARRLAYVPQRSELASELSVADVVAQGRYAYGRGLGRLSERDRDAVEQALDAADLGALRDRPFPWLSEGERRRALFARAMATGARTVLLDEPTAALDVRHGLELFALLRRLASEGSALAVVLHDIDHARRFADRALVLREGRAVAFGPVDEVVRSSLIEEVYGVEVRDRDALGFYLPEGSRLRVSG